MRNNFYENKTALNYGMDGTIIKIKSCYGVRVHCSVQVQEMEYHI